MNQFEKNITSIYKEEGKKWLIDLHKIVQQVATELNITDLVLCENLSFNYVLSSLQRGKAVILKISFLPKNLQKEFMALKAFRGYGVAEVVFYRNCVLILEKAVPGNSLLKYIPDRKIESLSIICRLMKRLHEAPSNEYQEFPHITDWVKTIDKNWPLPIHYLEKARKLKKKLLLNSKKNILLHGDLHYDNVLINGSEFIIIDPKGVIGSSINEVWAFIKDPIADTEYVANYFTFDLQEVREWYFVHIMMAACWQIEDNIEPDIFLTLAEQIYSLV